MKNSSPLGTGFFKDHSYEIARQSYPEEVTEFLKKSFEKESNLNICEVGAGSGLFTSNLHKALSSNINKLLIVDPDPDSIKQHKQNFAFINEYPIEYLNSTSDNIMTTDKFDLIVCSHSFHWFNQDATKIAFSNILKDNGQVLIFARFHMPEDDETTAGWITLTRFGKRLCGVKNNLEMYSESLIDAFYGHHVERIVLCKKMIPLSLEILQQKIKTRINASSFSENEKKDLWFQKQIELDNYFNTFQKNGFVSINETSFCFLSYLK